MSESENITEEEFDALLDKLAAKEDDATTVPEAKAPSSSENITEEEFDDLLDKLEQEKRDTSAKPETVAATDSVVDSYLSDLCEQDDPEAERQTIVLQEHVGIANVADLRSELLAIENSTPVSIDVSSVATVDSAVVQLLYAFIRDSSAREREITWTEPTEEFLKVVDLLGMRSHLSLGENARDAA